MIFANTWRNRSPVVDNADASSKLFFEQFGDGGLKWSFPAYIHRIWNIGEDIGEKS